MRFANSSTGTAQSLDSPSTGRWSIYDLRSTYSTRLSASGVADEWVTQLLRQGDSQVFKKYSQMKLEMKREAHKKLNRLANEMSVGEARLVPVMRKMRRSGFSERREVL
jgi:Rod binding domain-containing protein